MDLLNMTKAEIHEFYFSSLFIFSTYGTTFFTKGKNVVPNVVPNIL